MLSLSFVQKILLKKFTYEHRCSIMFKILMNKFFFRYTRLSRMRLLHKILYFSFCFTVKQNIPKKINSHVVDGLVTLCSATPNHKFVKNIVSHTILDKSIKKYESSFFKMLFSNEYDLSTDLEVILAYIKLVDYLDLYADSNKKAIIYISNSILQCLLMKDKIFMSFEILFNAEEKILFNQIIYLLKEKLSVNIFITN